MRAKVTHKESGTQRAIETFDKVDGGAQVSSWVFFCPKLSLRVPELRELYQDLSSLNPVLRIP